MDPQLREELIVIAEKKVAEAPPELDSVDVLSAASERALAQFAEQHPEYQVALEELSGVGESKSDVIEEARELIATLSATPDELLEEYASLIDAELEADMQRNLQAIRSQIQQASLLELTAFDGDLTFWRDPQNWLGVLLTVIFLSLGAPFWFNALRHLLNLRDTLSPAPSRA